MSDAGLKTRDATLAAKLITVPVTTAASGDTTVRSVQAGQLFAVYGMYLYTEGAVAITWKSGSTSITGAILTTGAEPISVFGNVPILKGRARGDDLVINLGSAVGVRGWVTLTEAAF